MASQTDTSATDIDAPSTMREFTCDQCGQEIAWSKLLMLREAYQMPDAPELSIHEDCAALYIDEHEGIWDKMLILPDKMGWMFY